MLSSHVIFLELICRRSLIAQQLLNKSHDARPVQDRHRWGCTSLAVQGSPPLGLYASSCAGIATAGAVRL